MMNSKVLGFGPAAIRQSSSSGLLLGTAEALIYLTGIRLLLARLARDEK
ncbi:MAG: hypothetical protein ACLQUY_09170 [Ktedonobacterales bacterium]